MRYIVYVSLIIPIILAAHSCRSNGRVQSSQVDNIVFYAMPKGIDRVSNLVSFQELKREGRDSIIVNRSFIRRFSRMVNRLTSDPSRRTIDMRSAAIIVMNSGDSLIVAFGENWGTVILTDNGKDIWEFDDSLGTWFPSMHVNGTIMRDCPALFKFIDNYVYGPHSNDYWVNDNEKEFLTILKESNKNLDIP